MAPQKLGDGWIVWLLVTLVLEFLVLHANGFMAAAVYRTTGGQRQRYLNAAAFLFPYAVLSGIAALAMKSPSVAISFWTLTLNRWLGPLLKREHEDRFREAMVAWIVSLGLYCLIIPFMIFVPVPPLGLDGYHISPDAFPGTIESSGSHEYTLPQAMAAGALYFLLSGLSELFGHRWVPARWRRGTARPR